MVTESMNLQDAYTKLENFVLDLSKQIIFLTSEVEKLKDGK